MFIKPKIRLFLIAIAIAGAFLLDKFWISKNAKVLSELTRLTLEFSAPGIKNMTVPSFGLLPVLFIPLLVYTLTIIPYKTLRNKKDWLNVKGQLTQILLGLLSIPFFMIIGALLYLLVEKIYPETATKIAEAFVLTISIYFFNSEDSLLTLEGSIASLLGLIFGLYIVSKKVLHNRQAF